MTENEWLKATAKQTNRAIILIAQSNEEDTDPNRLSLLPETLVRKIAGRTYYMVDNQGYRYAIWSDCGTTSGEFVNFEEDSARLAGN